MIKYFLFLIVLVSIFSCKKNDVVSTTTDIIVNINVKHTVGATPFSINTDFTNPFNETYKLNKFHYYLSNFFMLKDGSNTIEMESDSYHFIKAENTATHSFSFKIKNASANQLVFMVGVDSTRNVSGAQTGALDPLNGMFWTWNTGYIMAKMEGTSPQSTAVSNLVTYHIGGYAGINKAQRWITLNLPNSLLQGNTRNITIKCDINKFFNGIHNLKIMDEAIMMNHGTQASKYADNYATMFTLQ